MTNLSQRCLNDYKMDTMQMCEDKGWIGPTIEQIWMYFTEEVGELASSIRRNRNQFRDRKKSKIEAEMGDVFSYMFQLAYMLNIDLDQMWSNHKIKVLKKKYMSDSVPKLKNEWSSFRQHQTNNKYHKQHLSE
jgi:NTP pyrophosphatase (non-canonical NTP hydrolase)